MYEEYKKLQRVYKSHLSRFTGDAKDEFERRTSINPKSGLSFNGEKSIDDWNNKKDILDFYKTTDIYVYGLVNYNDEGRISAILYPLLGIKGRKILDWGGGIGSLSYILSDKNKVYYYELESKTKDFAEYVFKKEKKDITILKEEDLFKQKYDIILCVDVLEHIKNPMEVVKKLTEYLSPGGLFLTTGLLFASGPIFPMHLKENYNYQLEYNNYMNKNYINIFFQSTPREFIYLWRKK